MGANVTRFRFAALLLALALLPACSGSSSSGATPRMKFHGTASGSTTNDAEQAVREKPGSTADQQPEGEEALTQDA